MWSCRLSVACPISQRLVYKQDCIAIMCNFGCLMFYKKKGLPGLSRRSELQGAVRQKKHREVRWGSMGTSKKDTKQVWAVNFIQHGKCFVY